MQITQDWHQQTCTESGPQQLCGSRVGDAAEAHPIASARGDRKAVSRQIRRRDKRSSKVSIASGDHKHVAMVEELEIDVHAAN